MQNRHKRILWLCNHVILYGIEPKIIESLGFEVFIPKTSKNNFFYTTYEYDKNLTIPKEDLNILNNFDFYNDVPNQNIIDILNKYFATVITVMTYPGHFYLMQYFKGKIILRAFGLLNNDNYFDDITNRELSVDGSKLIFFNKLDDIKFKLKKFFKKDKQYIKSIYLLKKIKNRVFLGYAYKPIIENEVPFFKKRGIYLPMPLAQSTWDIENTWVGSINKIMYVCPYMKYDPAQMKAFENFSRNLADLPYNLFGRDVGDNLNKNIVGFLEDKDYTKALQNYKCMFFDSRQPRHVRANQLEAIITGMPVIFLDGGLMEYLGGKDQPGMCHTYKEAREKLERILNNDESFIKEIKEKQIKIVESFRNENVKKEWEKNLLPILKDDENI